MSEKENLKNGKEIRPCRALHIVGTVPPKKIAAGYTLAEESGNGTVLASKMVDELFKINDKGEQLRRIDEEMIPKTEVLKCEEGKGNLLFRRTMAMLRLSHPLPEIGGPSPGRRTSCRRTTLCMRRRCAASGR